VLTSIFIRIPEFFSADLRRQKFGGGFGYPIFFRLIFGGQKFGG